MTGRVAAIVEQSWHRVPGGTAMSTVRMLAALAARGDWDVVGVAAAHRRPPQASVVPPVPVWHMRLGRRVLYEAWHRLRRPLVQSRTGPVDVVHATGGAVPPAGDAALVVTIHDLAFLRNPDHFSRHGVRFMTRGFELAHRHADMILVPSEATADDCESRGIGRERLRVVPWGVDPARVDDEARMTARERYDLPERFVLWVGTAEPRKNLERLVTAAGRSRAGLPLVLVGPAGWGVDVEALVAATPHPVRRIGEVPADDLEALYDLAEVFVYPSLLEGFGMPVLEAMAHGTPVVTSAATSTAEVAGAAARLVDANDVDSIATAIDEITGDPELRGRLAAAGRERAASMTWEHTAAATADAYEAVRP